MFFSSAPMVQASDPFAATEMHKRALASFHAGNLAEAERMCRRILEGQPVDVQSLHLLGLIELRRGKTNEGARLIRAALDLKPDDPVALRNLGHALATLGRFQEALAKFDRALALKPDFAVACNSRGIALKNLNRLAEALGAFDRSVALKPDYADALNNRGNVLKALSRHKEALSSFDQALALEPDSAEALNNRAIILMELGRFQEALASADRALAAKPNFAEGLNTRGLALKDLKRYQDALTSFERALAVKPDFAEAFRNRSIALWQTRRCDEALANCARALAIDSNFADAHWTEAMLRLFMGDFERGWEKYEWRWKCPESGSTPRNLPQPLWLGQQDIKGKTILLHAEQGLGDTLQFCRYASLVAEQGASVILEVQPVLKALLASLAGPAQLIAQGEPLPAFDFHCPLLSLPLALRTTLQSIPAKDPYLAPAEDRLRLWQERLGPPQALRVGLAWSGNPKHKNDHNRSMPLAQLKALDALGVELYSLQQEVRESDRAALATFETLKHFGSELSDFADTAALVSLMDVVVSVDTAAAHLAGALGKPVWILLPRAGEWRWLTDRDDSPWYPSARLFRQPAFDDWDSVVQRLLLELPRLAPQTPTAPAQGGQARRTTQQVRPVPRASAVPKKAKADTLADRIGRGIAYFQSGRLADAAHICREVLGQQPSQFDALHLLGVVRSQQGASEEALALLTKAVRIKPQVWFAHNSLGTVLNKRGRFEDALASFDRALALEPDNAGAHNNRGVVLIELGRLSEALASAGRALARRPGFVEAMNTRGAALRKLNRCEEALASYDQALKLKPDCADALYNRANTLRDLKLYDEALASYDQALKLKPDAAGAVYNNLANAQQDYGRYDEALACYERALALNPDDAEAHWNESLCRLLIGDFGRGWQKHEWRWRAKRFSSPRRNLPQPLWLGQQDIKGKTILLHAEQGLGDTLQFCRYASLVAEQGASVILEVQPVLKALLASLAGPAQLIAQGEPLPAFDFHCPLLSLPLALRTTLQSIPARIPYLAPAEDRLRLWRERLGPPQALRVGLAWSGNPKHKNDHNRSMPLAQLKALDALGVELYSLQQEVRESDRAVLATFETLKHYGYDFADTAALASLMDVVVSVDTAAAHLAGALGKPVWILLPRAGEWRWLTDRDESPWYPSARLFRQPAFDDWDSVVQRVTHELRSRIEVIAVSP